MRAAQEQTRRRAIQAIERHIIAVKEGKVRLGLTPEEVDRYVADEYKRLKTVKYCG